MRVAIPSYQRSDSINKKSLKFLYEQGFEAKDIDLFVANEEEESIYRKVVDSEVNIVVGHKGLIEIRNFIFHYYTEGSKLLILDDDIEGLKSLNYEQENLSDCYNLKTICKKGFELCEEKDQKLWGLYTCANPRFMKKTDEFTSDYKFIIGNLFGCVNCKEMNSLSVLDIDDVERSIRSYLIYGGSIRLNHFAVKTKFLKNTGGAQQENRIDRIHSSIDILLEKYPKLLYTKSKKSGIRKSIILRDMRKTKI